MITQVLINLLSNAIKFSNHSGTIEIKLDEKLIDEISISWCLSKMTG